MPASASNLQPPTSNPLASLYLHVPFCTLKCAYCDFNSYARLDALIRPYVDALIAEIGLWRDAVAGRPVQTVYFGGGTPSLLPLGEVQRIMAALRATCDLSPDAEITLEANPGTVHPVYLRGLLAAGINRLSLGVQSFFDDELEALDRIHSAEEAEEAYSWARQAGFQRVSLDLIYGLSGQPLERWQRNVERALALEPDHLSFYALTVEEGTKLAHDVEKGVVAAPDPDLQAAMYEWTGERLDAAGFGQYEISNWARPGQECRHNLVYWRNGEWVGLGAGAHSHLVEWNKEQGTGNRGPKGSRVEGKGSGQRSGTASYRFADVYSPQQYIRRIRETAADPPAAGDMGLLLKGMRQVASVEEQSPEMEMADTAILALRLNEGLDLAGFRERFGRDFESTYFSRLDGPLAAGLLEWEYGSLRLTPRGRLLSNEVFVRLLPD